MGKFATCQVSTHLTNPGISPTQETCPKVTTLEFMPVKMAPYIYIYGANSYIYIYVCMRDIHQDQEHLRAIKLLCLDISRTGAMHMLCQCIAYNTTNANVLHIIPPMPMSCI